LKIIKLLTIVSIIGSAHAGVGAQTLSPVQSSTPSKRNKVTQKIKGTLLEKGTKKPLAGVNVYILPEGLKSTTNKKGQFTFKEVTLGKHEWVVSAAGYQRLKEEFLPIDFLKDPRLFLPKASYVDLETTVIGRVRKSDPAKTTLSQEQFIKAPGSGGDPIRALENLPGVLQSFDANVAIQGSPPEDTRYLIEGHEIPFIFHFFGLNTGAVPETIDSIDFLAAGYGPEFGRASSGIINLNLREPRTDRTHGMAFVDFTALGGYFEGPITEDGSESFFIGGRYSYVGELLRLGAEAFADDEEGGAPSFNTAPTYFDLNTTYIKKFNGRSKLRILGIASQDRVEAISPNADNPTFSGRIFGTTEFFRIIPKYDFKISKNQSFATSIGGGLDRNIFEPGEQRLRQQNTRITWRSHYQNKVTDWYRLTLGTDFLHESFQFDARIAQAFFRRDEIDIPFEFSDLIITNTTGSDLRQGYYWQNEFSFADNRWILSPNLRIDSYERHQETVAQPRGVLQYYIDETSSLSFSAGLYVQPELIVNLLESTGNPDLKPSRSVHYSLRYTKDFRGNTTDGLQFRSSLFYKDLEDLISDSPNTVVRNGRTVPERFNNDGEGHVQGFDFLLQYSWNRFNLNLGYTFTESRRIDPITRQELPSEQDQSHNLNFTLLKSWNTFTVSTRFRYVTGLPFTPFVGGVYAENSDVYIPIPGNRLSQRFEDFWSLDVRFDRKWIYNTWILSIYLDIQNVTNQQNEVGRVYNFDFSQADSTMGLPILPTFGVRGEF
jgi:hypothetical protein